MVNRDPNNRNLNERDGDMLNQMLEMQTKWGVSAAEIQDALEKVGNDQRKMEEYLVNNKFTNRTGDGPSFQKRDLNEDETY